MPESPRRKGRVWYADRWFGSGAYLFLTLAEQGAYRNLLDQMHLRGGLLPDDEAVLERASGCRTPGEWAGLRGNVLAHFLRTAGGYRNEAADEIERQAELVRGRQAKYRGSHGDSPRDLTDNTTVTSRVTSRVVSRVPLTHTPTLSQSRSTEEEPNPVAPETGTPAVTTKIRVVGPQDQAARALSAALGSSLAPCRKQVAALVGAGWDLPRILTAIETHAEPGVAPWDWTKAVRAASNGTAQRSPVTGKLDLIEIARRLTDEPARNGSDHGDPAVRVSQPQARREDDLGLDGLPVPLRRP